MSNRSTATSLPSMVDMHGQTIAEKILSRTSGKRCYVGDFAVCRVDRALGTDGSTPLAIDYFDATGTLVVLQPDRLVFVLDHHAPVPSPKAAALHAGCAIRVGITYPVVVDNDEATWKAWHNVAPLLESAKGEITVAWGRKRRFRASRCLRRCCCLL